MTSPWSGAGLAFGRGHEDWSVEAEVLPAHGRIFCVAGAGDTVFALAARGASVTAVDVNPAQVDYVRARIAGARPEEGVVERRLSRLRRLGPLAGWRREELRRFCDLDDLQEQSSCWRERLDNPRFRAALAILLSSLALRRLYPPRLVRGLPTRFDLVIRRRFARGFARHPNRSNPFARDLFLGEAAQPGPADVEVVHDDAVSFLERVDPGSFDGFSLSNVLDGAPPGYRERLLAAVGRAGIAGAPYVLRSFGEPSDVAEAEWAARDRSLVWGRIRIDAVQ